MGDKFGCLSESSWSVRIYMAGDVAVAKQIIRETAWVEGMCVTISPTDFIYTGGEETGFIIGIEQYPRFPTSTSQLDDKAMRLAKKLMPKLNQKSAMVVTPGSTFWLSLEPPGAPKKGKK